MLHTSKQIKTQVVARTRHRRSRTQASPPIAQAARPSPSPGIMQNPASQQMQRTGTRERACGSGTDRNALVKHTRAHSRKQHHTEHTCSPVNTSSRHNETRHPSTADAAHRHPRAGLRERNGPKPTRGARADRPAPSQHRAWGGGGEAAMKGDAPALRELLDAFPATNGSSDVVTFLLVRNLGVRRWDHSRPSTNSRPSPPWAQLPGIYVRDICIRYIYNIRNYTASVMGTARARVGQQVQVWPHESLEQCLEHWVASQ